MNPALIVVIVWLLILGSLVFPPLALILVAMWVARRSRIAREEAVLERTDQALWYPTR